VCVGGRGGGRQKDLVIFVKCETLQAFVSRQDVQMVVNKNPKETRKKTVRERDFGSVVL
jgi:hypothetical protein